MPYQDFARKADVKEALGNMANEVARKWGIGAIDTEEIEKNSDLTLDGGFNFNSGWNFSYRNQAGAGKYGRRGSGTAKRF